MKLSLKILFLLILIFSVQLTLLELRWLDQTIPICLLLILLLKPIVAFSHWTVSDQNGWWQLEGNGYVKVCVRVYLCSFAYLLAAFGAITMSLWRV